MELKSTSLIRFSPYPMKRWKISTSLFLKNNSLALGFNNGTFIICDNSFHVKTYQKIFDIPITSIFEHFFKIHTISISTEHFIAVINLFTYECLGIIYSPNIKEIVHLTKARIVIIKTKVKTIKHFYKA